MHNIKVRLGIKMNNNENSKHIKNFHEKEYAFLLFFWQTGLILVYLQTTSNTYQSGIYEWI